MVWFDALEIAIIEKDPQKISDLINSLPSFETLDEMKKAQYLLAEARLVIDTMREEAGSAMIHLKKHIDFLKSTQNVCENKFDVSS